VNPPDDLLCANALRDASPALVDQPHDVAPLCGGLQKVKKVNFKFAHFASSLINSLVLN
jgi:hypothetical protein